MLGEWYLPPGKCQAISTITEGIISISHPAPLSSQTRIPQTSSPLVDKSQATQAALLQIRRSEPASAFSASPVLPRTRADRRAAVSSRRMRAPCGQHRAGGRPVQRLDVGLGLLVVGSRDAAGDVRRRDPRAGRHQPCLPARVRLRDRRHVRFPACRRRRDRRQRRHAHEAPRAAMAGVIGGLIDRGPGCCSPVTAPVAAHAPPVRRWHVR